METSTDLVEYRFLRIASYLLRCRELWRLITRMCKVRSDKLNTVGFPLWNEPLEYTDTSFFFHLQNREVTKKERVLIVNSSVMSDCHYLELSFIRRALNSEVSLCHSRTMYKLVWINFLSSITKTFWSLVIL